MKHQLPSFRNEAGAIDLASVMTGLIVIGLIGGVIAATIFAVIPWAQDNAAKQQLSNIENAQNAYAGLSADPNNSLAGSIFTAGVTQTAVPTGGYSYGTLTNDESSIAAAGLMTPNAETYCSEPMIDGSRYVSFARSGSGKIWFTTNNMAAGEASQKHQVYTGDPASTCLEGLSAGGEEDEDGTTPPAITDPWIIVDDNLRGQVENSFGLWGDELTLVEATLFDNTKFTESNISFVSVQTLEGLELSPLTTINGYMSLWSLTDIKGFDNITHISEIDGANAFQGNFTLPIQSFDTLTIVDADGVTDISFPNLNSVTGGIILRNNNALTTVDLNGFSSDITGSVAIQNNPALNSVTGLQNLSSASALSIMGNFSLNTFPDFASLETLNGSSSNWFTSSNWKTIAFPALKTVNSHIQFESLYSLERVLLPELQTVNGGMFFENADAYELVELLIPELRDVHNLNVYFFNPNFELTGLRDDLNTPQFNVADSENGIFYTSPAEWINR